MWQEHGRSVRSAGYKRGQAAGEEGRGPALMLRAPGGSLSPQSTRELPALRHAPCRHIFPSQPLHIPCLHLRVALGLQGTKDQQPPPWLAAFPALFTHLLSSG